MVETFDPFLFTPHLRHRANKQRFCRLFALCCVFLGGWGVHDRTGFTQIAARVEESTDR